MRSCGLQCPASNSTCNKCQKKGHWATVCRSTSNNTANKQHKNYKPRNAALQDACDDDPKCSATILAATKDTTPSDPSLSFLSGFPIHLLIDTGSDCTFI